MPRLEGLFARGMKRDKGWRNQKIAETVRDWGYIVRRRLQTV
jgi:hypothetical protein